MWGGGGGGEGTIKMHISTEGSGISGQGVHVGRRGGGERTVKMHISTEGSGMPSMTPKTGSPCRVSGQGVQGVGGGEMLKCTYLLKVQACLP